MNDNKKSDLILKIARMKQLFRESNRVRKDIAKLQSKLESIERDYDVLTDYVLKELKEGDWYGWFFLYG